MQGNHVFLRALEPEDLDFLYVIENNTELWSASSSQTPYSRDILKQYLANAHQDIYQAKQLRLAICEVKSNQLCGFIDLFDFDPQHRRAGVGIIIAPEHQRNGMGSESLALLIDYAFTILHLNQLYCNISSNNLASECLFTKFGFVKSGIKKHWNYFNGCFYDENFYQLLNNVTIER